MGMAVCFNCASGHTDPGVEHITTRATTGLSSIPLALVAESRHPESDACPSCLSPLAGEGGGLLAAGFMLVRNLSPEYSMS